MTAPASKPPRDLAGKIKDWWLVLAYVCQHRGDHYWRCMCRNHLAEKVIRERDITDREVNRLSSPLCPCQKPRGNLSGCFFGEWEVLWLTATQAVAPRRLWKCRCSCGTQRDVPEDELAPGCPSETLSCGCRPKEEVLAVLGPIRDRAAAGLYQACSRASLGRRRRLLDEGWTPDMEGALCTFQPACVLCPATDDLTNHHVRPLGRGGRLEPGNAVRLCRACNSWVRNRGPEKLAPRLARKLETAAAQFK
jgi:hypothetical protein